MKDQPTSEQISKLPKWAQVYVTKLERERDEANKILYIAMDDQKESPFYTEEFRGIENAIEDRYFKRYFQARFIYVEHEGIRLSVKLPCGVQGREGIEISWESTGPGGGNICMLPTSFQRIRLFLPDGLKQAQDMLADSVALIDFVAMKLSVDAEPHQTFNDRLIETAEQNIKMCGWTQVDTETARSECGYEVMHERGTEFPNFCYECGGKISGHK
jgi:hypothetical protein